MAKGVESLYAYIDESGQRGLSMRSSSHFIMAAAVFSDSDVSKATALLSGLRQDLNRTPGSEVSWKKLRSHSHRLRAAQALASAPWLTISSVVVCKQELADGSLNDDQRYLYTMRFLLERLSWIGRARGAVVDYTLAHIVRFPKSKLRRYESALRSTPDCSVDWRYLSEHGGRIDQPHRLEHLQLGDLAASACGAAFNADEFGNTERRYLQELAPRLYRRGTGPNSLTSYGLKVHPWTRQTQHTYPWIISLGR